MKITVRRSGGIAGMERVWSVQALTPDDRNQWQPLVEACPWDQLSDPAASGAGTGAGAVKTAQPKTIQPDRFIYRIRAGERRATLPEQDLVGPWRVLVETMRAAAELSAPPD